MFYTLNSIDWRIKIIEAPTAITFLHYFDQLKFSEQIISNNPSINNIHTLIILGQNTNYENYFTLFEMLSQKQEHYYEAEFLLLI